MSPDLFLIGAAAAWCTPFVVFTVVIARLMRRPLSDSDRRCSEIDDDLRRKKQAAMQERAARAAVRGQRRVVCELQRETDRA